MTQHDDPPTDPASQSVSQSVEPPARSSPPSSPWRRPSAWSRRVAVLASGLVGLLLGLLIAGGIALAALPHTGDAGGRDRPVAGDGHPGRHGPAHRPGPRGPNGAAGPNGAPGRRRGSCSSVPARLCRSRRVRRCRCCPPRPRPPPPSPRRPSPRRPSRPPPSRADPLGAGPHTGGVRALFDLPSAHEPTEAERAAPVPEVEAVLFDFSNTPFLMIGADEWLRRIAADTGRTLDDAAQRGRDLGGARHRAAMRGWFAHEPFPVPWRACAGRRSCRRPRRRRGRAAARQGPRAVPPSARRSDVPRSRGRVRGFEGRKGVHTDFDGAGRRAVPFRVTTADGRFEWT